MASYKVSYIFDFLVKNLNSLKGVGDTAKKMAGGLDTAGAAATKMAAQVSKAAAAMNAHVAAAAKAPAAMAGYGSAMERMEAQAYRAAAATRRAAADAAWMSKGYVRPSGGGAWVKPPDDPAKQAGKKESGGPMLGFGGKLLNAWAGYHMTKSVWNTFDHMIDQVAAVDTMRRKLAFSLGGGERGEKLAQQAVETATEMSIKFPNTKVAENMHIIDDLRANLPESMEHVLDGAVEPFVKLHSFFKGWQGGKHSGNAEGALKDIGLAIRSGELMGNVTAAEIANHAQYLAVARAQFGDKFKVSEYFTAQKSANQALPGASDQFKYVVFPMLTQRLGSRAGTGLATLYNKTVGGIANRQGSLEAWRSIDMINMNQVALDKKGKINPQSVVGNTKFLRGQDTMASDPHLFLLNNLLPSLAAKGKLGNFRSPQAKALSDAWAAGDVETLAHIVKDINSTKLSQALTPLGYDRTAISEMFEIVKGLPAALRDIDGFGRIKKAIEDGAEFASYDMAKQKVSASADRLLQEVTGSTMMGNLEKALSALAADLDQMTNGISQFKKDPRSWGQVGKDFLNNIISEDAKWGPRPAFNSMDYSWGSAAQRGENAYADFENSRGRARSGGMTAEAAAIPQSISVTSKVEATFGPAAITVSGTVDASGMIRMNGSGSTQANMARAQSAAEVGGGGVTPPTGRGSINDPRRF